MPRHGEVTLAFADGEHVFRLGIGELRELQTKTGVGPVKLFRRLAEGDWLVDDLREIVRLGLIGGGSNPPEALRLVGTYVDDRPWTETVPVAAQVLQAALFRPEELAPAGKPGAPKSRRMTAN